MRLSVFYILYNGFIEHGKSVEHIYTLCMYVCVSLCVCMCIALNFLNFYPTYTFNVYIAYKSLECAFILILRLTKIQFSSKILRIRKLDGKREKDITEYERRKKTERKHPIG